MLLVLLTLCQSIAAPSATVLADTWASQFKILSEHTDQPVLLGDADFQRVSEGKIAKRRLSQDGPDRAIGVGWTPHSREAIWVAIIDEVHNTMVNDLVEKRLGKDATGAKLLYQRLNLPWPFQDRQWVIAISNNRALSEASNGQTWERSWRLAEPIDGDPASPEAMWIPTLDGAWIAIPLEGGTLLIYQVRTTIGGAIPDEIVTRWAMSTLDEMLENVFSRAAEIPEHYTPGHEPINGGDEKPIATF